MDDGNPTLEVGFAIDTGNSFGSLTQLDDLIDRATASAVNEFAKVEKASARMINLGGATASVTSFSAAATRELASVAREKNRVEKAGEGFIRQLEREAAAIGKTRDELRAAKGEALALAAAKVGNTDLAGRLRGAVEARQAAANRAAAAVEAEAKVVREAAQAYAMFEAAARKGAAAMREVEAVRKAEAAAAEAQSIRAAARAYDLFEAAARRGAAAMREQEAAQRAADQARRAAIASADSFAAKLEAEATAIGRTSAELREMEVARRAAAADEAGLSDQAQRIRAAGAAYAEAEARAAALAAQERQLAVSLRETADAARAAAAAQAAQDASLNSLRSSIDPLHATQQRLGRELENAVRLYRSGAIGQDEYARSTTELAGRLDEVQRAQARANAGIDDGINKRKLSAGEMANVVAQLNDIGVSLAGGQNPFLVLIQQGSQLQGIAMQSGLGITGLAQAILGLAIVTTPTVAATAALAEATAAHAAAQVAAATTGSAAAVAAAELTIANELAATATAQHAIAEQALVAAQVAATGAAATDAAAQAALATAQAAAAVTAAELTAAEASVASATTASAAASELAATAAAQLAAAQTAAANATAAAARTATRALAPWLTALVVIAAPLAVAGMAFKRWKDDVSDDAHLKQYAASLGLTKQEMKKLGDVSVTTGDMVSGMWTTIQDRMNMKIEGKKIIDYLFGPNDAQIAINFVSEIYGVFVGGYRAMVDLWDMFSKQFAGFFSSSSAAAVSSFQPIVDAAGVVGKTIGDFFDWLLSKIQSAVRFLSGAASSAMQAMGLDKLAASVADTAGTIATAVTTRVTGATKEASGAINRFATDAAAAGEKAARNRIDKKAAELKADRTPDKADKNNHAEKLVRDAEAIEAQIRNLYKLADAYRVSDAAALIAEARVKAESAAIKQRADIEASVDRQVRLSIAQRVADSGKAIAGMRGQAEVQERVNAMVAAGLVPAEQAAELIRAQTEDLPLLAAIEAARMRNQIGDAATATKALNDQRAARQRLTDAERKAVFDTAMKEGGNQLEDLREELRLVGATDLVRARALTTLRATREAAKFKPEDRAAYIDQQVDIAVQTERLAIAQREWNDALTFTADRWDLIARNVQNAAAGMADAFGKVGQSIGDVASIYASYEADRARLSTEREQELREAGESQAAIDRANTRFALQSATQQIGMFGDMASAAKGFFNEKSKGYQVMLAAEKAFRAVEFAMSVRAMAQDIRETATKIASAVARTAIAAKEAVVRAISSMPFPLNIAAGAATVAALAAVGVGIAGAFSSGKNSLPKSNEGTGSVLGDSAAKSESIKRAIDALKDVDTLTLNASRDMANSLRSIDNQIGGLASVLVRGGDINASAGVNEGFKTNAIGSVLKVAVPIFGGMLSSLFGSTTSVVASGLFGKSQTIGSVLNGGFDAQTYSDVEKKKKFLGITTGKSYSTQYGNADATLENQFTLILRQFNDAIAAAAGPLGASTDEVQRRLNGFVVNIGKIDLKGLTGTQIQEKLEAVFGAAADSMAKSAFPGIDRFQQVGEGAFETLVRVASTVEAVTASLGNLGVAAGALNLDAKMGLADQFETIGALTNAVDAYFTTFYSKQEQAAARSAQMGKVFDSLGVTMPTTLAGFRALVDAQNLTTAAGQETYATLLRIAPAFAQLQSTLEGAKSAADILSERQDLERRMLDVRGDTAALRALDLAKLDASNRALQMQIWAIEDAKEAASAADALRQAWTSVGDSIMDEVKRIRGLSGGDGDGSFANLSGQFNAASAAARAGDQDAAKSLPGISQALLRAASLVATSRQEMDRVQAETAASLEATYAAISRNAAASPAATNAAILASLPGAASQAKPAANDDSANEMQLLRQEIAAMRSENNAGHATTAANTGRAVRMLDNVTSESGGNAISVANVA
ncbi:hypothetical protein [Sphingomonas sp. CFBP 13720]|uniref:hypothetical protein n=1 Tax=Sphingomonas sp. CFBP 13720 TaxID=2775302 RepID=UPI00177D288F|nr:hypothetical protein [Sphingomonas sp. CFBP 13720]MBD8677922.1 hypothetical protein [Sphingomonas sp. CFBP 13720]